MGFSESDFADLQARLNSGKVRFGPRIMIRPPIHVPGLPDLTKPNRPAKQRKGPDEPGYERFQLRLW